MKFIATLIFTLFLSAITYSQVDITDNMVASSGDTIFLKDGNYEFADLEEDGVIHIKDVDNVYIDGFYVELKGEDFKGYGIKIENSSNVTIANFQNISGYFYAIHAINSPGLVIENCTLNSNKRDDEGWIVIFEGPEGAHGGAIYMEECQNGRVENCAMTDQNDAVALYNCDSITVHNNRMAWNTSFGIRMYHTHNSTITDNDASHINRPLEDPTDCASILLLDAFNNVVTGNDFTYSGDGIFLNNYNTMEPANNYFAFNDCSYSPHNAIEAVFSDGNIFEYNTCNYSNYGFWLGYSFNSIIRSNTIRHNSGLDANGGGGIAIDRGYNNIIEYNTISNNSNGIQLWEGNPISPYGNNNSRDYEISKNLLYGNHKAFNISDTENVLIDSCILLRNYVDAEIKGSNTGTRITESKFTNTITKVIDNQGFSAIDLFDNTFDDYGMIDSDLFDCKFINVDNLGVHTLKPISAQSDKTAELTEPDGENSWDDYYFVEDAALTEVRWDFNEAYEGQVSLFCDTDSGFDVILHYFPADTSKTALFNIDAEGSISFAAKINITDPNNPWGVQQSYVRIGDACGNYFQYENEYFAANNNPAMNASLNQWATYEIPISGNDTWKITNNGLPDLSAITYVEFNVDVWEYGYELWLDAVRLPTRTTSISDVNLKPLTLSPNPTTGILQVNADFQLIGQRWCIFSEDGKVLKTGEFVDAESIDVTDLSQGMYYLSLPLSSETETYKFIIIN